MSPVAKRQSVNGWQEGSRLSDDEYQRIDDSMSEAEARRAEVKRRREVLRHPLYLAIQSAAGGMPPSSAELDALALSAGHRRKVDGALAEIATARGEGELQQADDLASDGAFGIIDALPEAQQAADYLEDEEVDNRGPRELAEEIQQW
jgi:hypothetical protein